MFRTTRTARTTRTRPPTLEGVLAALPDPITVYIVEGTYFVVAPSGLFVVAENPIDLAVGAAAAANGADRIRDTLATRLPWVPFVDAVVVSDRDGDGLPALTVPIDLVASTILGGPDVIDRPTLERLSALDFPVLRRPGTA